MHKAKSLAIAGTLVGGMTLAGQASAAIVSNNNTEGFENEFFISIVNNVTQQNIGVDLNYTTEDFLNGVGGCYFMVKETLHHFLKLIWSEGAIIIQPFGLVLCNVEIPLFEEGLMKGTAAEGWCNCGHFIPA